MDECNRLLSELQSEKSALMDENRGVHDKNDDLTKEVAALEGEIVVCFSSDCFTLFPQTFF